MDITNLINGFKNFSHPGFYQIAEKIEMLHISELYTFFINEYQTTNSSIFNRMLRKQNLDFNELFFKDVEDIINTGLSKLPQYNKILYRQEGVDSIKIKKWGQQNINRVICYPAFTSCSKVNWTNDFYFEIRPLATNSNAYDLHELNPNHSEKEVLFKTKTNFKVISVLENKIILNETKKEATIIQYQNEGLYKLSGNTNISKPTSSDNGLM